VNSERIEFPRQPTIAYIDSFLKAVRSVLDLSGKAVVFDLSRCREVSSVLVCFLCGLVDLSHSKKNAVSLVLPRNKSASRAIRAVQELVKEEGEAPIRIAERMCQARKIVGNNSAVLEEILDLIGENLAITESAKDSLIVVLTELLTNAIDHSGERACYVCAGAWGRSRMLHLTLLDFGMGIPQKLRTRYPHYEDDVEALRDLLKKGLTTRVGLEGGRGYRYIQEILRRNKGRLHIFSGRAKVVLKYDKGEYNYRKARKAFTGTCVDIEFNLDAAGLEDYVAEAEKGDYF
jgi:anti-sigma regulatory factor (Ser/Thr protein kinase)